jgi:cytosine/adenosine deaminase-related metal-dependent hydrolase
MAEASGSEFVRVDAGILVASDGSSHRRIDRGVLVFQGDTIVHVGERYEGQSDRVIDARGCIVAPGFVTTHAHLSDSPLTKSVLEDRGNKQFYFSGLYEFLHVIANATTSEMAIAALRCSVLEVLRSGTTTIVELGVPVVEETVGLAASVGLRAYVAPMFRSASWVVEEDRRVAYDWSDPEAGEQRLQRAVEFVERHEGTHDDPIRTFLAPAQVDTCSPELLERVAAAARDLGVPVQIHAGQSVIEFQEMLRRHGLTPIAFLESVGLLHRNLIIGHGLFTGGHSWLAYPDDSDLSLLAASGASVAHCPWVFGRRGIVMESFARYLEAGVHMSLGTDTFPQSMLHEMRVAATLSKVSERDTQVATAGDVFEAATLGGAYAIGREDLGRLAVGAKADFVCYRMDSLSMAPVRDPIKSIVYSAQPSDVVLSVIAGREVLRDGVVDGLQEEVIARGLQVAAEALWAELAMHDSRGRTVEDIAPQTLPTW